MKIIRLLLFLSIVVVACIPSLAFPSEEDQDQNLQPFAETNSTRSYRLPPGDEVITVPKYFSATYRKGPDFGVYYFGLAGSDESKAFMGLYFGTAPDLKWPSTAREVRGRVGPVPVTWHIWTRKQNGKDVFHRETLVKGFYGTAYTVIHIFISGEDQQMVAELASAASSLRRK